MPFCLIWRFSWIISSTCYCWDSSVAVTGLTYLALPHKLVSPSSACLNCHTQHQHIYPHILPAYGDKCQREEFFFAIKNSITAWCLNLTSPQPFTSTGSELELWTDAGSGLSMVEKRHHVTARNRFYPVFIPLIKKYNKGRKTFQPVLKVNATAFSSVLCICIQETTYNTHSLLWSSLALPSLTICYNFSFNLLHILVIQCYEDHTRNH